MAVLAVFEPDVKSRARLRDALKRHHQLDECESWEELWRRLIADPVDGCIIDPYNPFDSVSLAEILHFRRRFPEAAIVVFSDFTGHEFDLYHLGRMGIDGVILAGEEDRRYEIRNTVEGALSSWLASRVADALEGVLPPIGIRCIQWSVAHAEESPQVRDLARAMRVSPRSLSRTLRREGLPSPRRMLMWGRLFQAARLFAGFDLTVEDVAFRLGYSTGATLARALRNEVGLSPSEISKGRAGVDGVMRAFLAAVQEGESAPRRWSTPDARRAVLRSFPVHPA